MASSNRRLDSRIETRHEPWHEPRYDRLTSRGKVARLLRGVRIDSETRFQLHRIVKDLELAKSQLKGHVAERKTEIHRLAELLQKARTELEQNRKIDSEDGLTKLYHAGAQLITQQSDEIKGLKADVQRTRDDVVRQKESYVKTLRDKDKQGVQVEKEKKELGKAVQDLEARMASMTVDNAAKERVEQQLADARALINTLHGLVDSRNRTVDSLRASELKMSAENADLQSKLRVAEKSSMDWRSTAREQWDTLQQLAEENKQLKGETGEASKYECD